MGGNRSFKEYVADRFENELFVTIQSYIADNYTESETLVA